MKIHPAKQLRGQIDLPGDKSISHRAGMFAALANGTTRIENFATSADCASTLACLADLGAGIERDGSTVLVTGTGLHGFTAPDKPLDCGNSGTTMRLISGILAGQAFESVLVGDESLQSRPMKRVIEPLELMGAQIESVDGKAPLRLAGRNPLKAIEYRSPVASAQIKSCVLLAGLNADRETSVIEPTLTRDHTERMLRWLGVDVRTSAFESGFRHSVSGGSELIARDLIIPADISSAAFFMVAAACLEGSEVVMPNVGLNPARRGVIDVLRRFGSQIEVRNEVEQCNEPVGEIVVMGGLRPRESTTPSAAAATPPIQGGELRGQIIADVIDEIPILAVFGTQLEGGLEVRDASELRVKESDRIAAVVENLRRMGADVEEFPDGFRVGRSYLKGAVIDSFGDHRIAMAFAVAGLFADGETTIEGAECAAVSFPDFFAVLEERALPANNANLHE
jgi:3-phosphoshikimate 1-carboxyvinyltransferase